MRSAPDSEVLLLKKKIIYQTPNGICAGKICQNDVHLGNISSVNNELTPWSLQLLQPSAQRSAPRTGTIVGGVDLARSWLPPGSTGMRGLRLGESEQAQMPRKRSGLHCSGFFLPVFLKWSRNLFKNQMNLKCTYSPSWTQLQREMPASMLWENDKVL